MELFEDRPAVSLKSFQVSNAWMASYSVKQGRRKTSSSKFLADWKHLRIVNQGWTFRLNSFRILKRNMEKYRTAGRLVILRPCPATGSLVTSFLFRAVIHFSINPK